MVNLQKGMEAEVQGDMRGTKQGPGCVTWARESAPPSASAVNPALSPLAGPGAGVRMGAAGGNWLIPG